jgi:plastocyanin
VQHNRLTLARAIPLLLPALFAMILVSASACEQERSSVRRRSTPSYVTAAPSDDGPAAENEIHIRNSEFNPARLEVEAGTTVLWINDDGTNHIISDQDLVWRVGILPPGGAGSFQFDNPGDHTYVCQIHRNMRGTLVVE